MFIKKIKVLNYRLFSSESVFIIDNLNIPDGINEGSGLSLFIGENGCGKTSLLEAFSLPLLSYKADGVELSDFYDIERSVLIEIFANKAFEFKGTMPKVVYKAKGFSFEASVRSRENKSYLSSIIVHDQKYIRADGQNKPVDSSPDLRVSVNNPWSGLRFNENDILYLDKSRIYQVKAGAYSQTRFDRLMEDFNLQYLKKNEKPFDCNQALKKISEGIQNNFLTEAISKFKAVCGETISLDHVDNLEPYKKSFFAIRKENQQHVSLESLGSGYEMYFSLLYSFYLSKQSGKHLIILIDEPELHLHPKLQEEFVKTLFEFSRDSQIIITTHSPLLVKQILKNPIAQVNILKKEVAGVKISSLKERLLPYLSANEINYIAFGLPTEEYHNELYEELKIRDDASRPTELSLKDFDIQYFQNSKMEPANFPYKGKINQVSVHTHLRTQIHHRGTVGKAEIEQVKDSIEKMRGFLSTDATLSSGFTNTDNVVLQIIPK